MISFKEIGRMGRIGNQLFQVSATVALAARHGGQYIFPPWAEESNFNLRNCFSANIPNYPNYNEPFFHYKEIPYNSNLNLMGYFQSAKYFEDQKDLILSLLTPVKGFGIKWNHASIHVRKGDYVKLSRAYEQLDMSYYNKAMDAIKAPHYLVFSDDINWCKQHFHGNQFTFVEGTSPADDLALQAACEHNIIANSSFSWWGAYLNKNPSKIVIAPQRWFGPDLPHDTKDLVPNEWIKIA